MTDHSCNDTAHRFLMLPGLLVALTAPPLMAQQQAQPVPAATARTQPRDGQRDFDFEIGTWTTKLRRLEAPLSGSAKWVEYEGTSVVSAIMGGKANLVELDVMGPSGRIEGVALRLYDPAARQWSLNFASARGGVLTPPTIGEFKDGRGEFYAQDEFNGRAIFVRFVITKESADTLRFEQAFSDDGGRTWELNWIAIDTRRK